MNSRVVTQSQGTVVKIVPPAPIKRFQVFCIAGTLNLVPVTEFLWTAHLPFIPSSTSKRSEKKSTMFSPSRLDSGRREKINLNFYFHTSL